MIISRTPTRLSLLGGSTDFPTWFTKNGGLVVGGAINRYGYLTVRQLPPFHAHKHRVVYREIETVQKVADIQHKAVRAVIQYLNCPDAEGLEISHLSDLPGGSGTGSSSTFVVGLLNALLALQGKRMSAGELADAAIYVEQQLLQETVGCQDQTFAAHGGLNIIKFRQNGDISVFPLTLSGQEVSSLEAHLMLFFTGQSRTSSDIARAYAPTLDQHGREMWSLVRLAEEGIEAIYKGDYEKLGSLIDQSWRIKAGLAEGVATPTISSLYATARVCGAFGGKLTGAGAGGCLLLVVPVEKQDGVRQALEREKCVHIPFRFDFDGSVIIFADRRNHEVHDNRAPA